MWSACSAGLFAIGWLAMGSWPGTLLWRHLRLPPVFWLPLVLAAGSGVAFAVMPLYLWSPSVGQIASVVGPTASLAGFIGLRRSEHTAGQIPLSRPAWVPLLLLCCVTTGCLAYLRVAGVQAS